MSQIVNRKFQIATSPLLDQSVYTNVGYDEFLAATPAGISDTGTQDGPGTWTWSIPSLEVSITINNFPEETSFSYRKYGWDPLLKFSYKSGKTYEIIFRPLNNRNLTHFCIGMGYLTTSSTYNHLYYDISFYKSGTLLRTVRINTENTNWQDKDFTYSYNLSDYNISSCDEIRLSSTWTTNFKSFGFGIDTIGYEYKFYVDSQLYSTQYGYPGFEVTAPADPTKSGYRFTGWTPSVPAVADTSDHTFNAQFEQVVTYTFVSNGQTVATQQYAPGESVVAPADPTNAPEGKFFNKWSPDIPATAGSSDQTFTAQFRNPKTSFVNESGTEIGNYIRPAGEEWPDETNRPYQFFKTVT